MSRIDEALRRARGETGVTSTPLAYENPAEDVDLWDLLAETSERWSLPVESEIESEPSLDSAPAASAIVADVPSGAAAPPQRTNGSPTRRPILADTEEEISVIEVRPKQPDPQPVAAASVQPQPKEPLPARGGPATSLTPELAGSMLVRADAVEQYRKLAATLHQVQLNRGVRIVLCTSAVMSEGKTVTAANLALTLSESFQRRVLMIDADLYRPRLHSLFNVANREGLYEALGADADRKVNVVQVSPLLSLVTAGQPGPNPVQLLTSERLARLFEDAGTSFDWVIIDTPPVLVKPDAGLLMNVVDGAVFVVGAGMTSHKMAKRATDALGRDRIVGVVMNRVADRIIQEHYGGGYYGYGESASQPE